MLTLECTRLTPSRISCFITASRFLKPKQVTPIRKEIKRAELETSTNSDGNNIYRIVLITETQEIAFTRFYSQVNHLTKKVKTINKFIQNPTETSLIVKEDNREIWQIIGIILFVPISFIVSAKVLKWHAIYIFDRDAQELSVQGILMLPNGTFKSENHHAKNTTIPFSAIQQVQVMETSKSNGKESYQTNLVFKSGASILLEVSTDRSQHDEIAKNITEFVGISPN